MSKMLVEKFQGKFNIQPLIDHLCMSSDGTYKIEIKKVRRPRSNDQNGWLWGCIYPMLMEALLNAGWEFTNVEQVHEFFKSQMTAEEVVNKHTGEIIKFPESTAAMDTLTFATYCEKLRYYGKEFLGIDIPDPNEENPQQGSSRSDKTVTDSNQ